ncbi:MAG: DUF4491 family protein [Anaerolineales bacterium]|nr:DUF4491 family protein [Anaerolineales bacterium]MCX7609161.1 DUF4491 family protein [Anaerolineales bacterium]MDW8226915.1 DUF4491 family protein [Anaerolineales bacterium]
MVFNPLGLLAALAAFLGIWFGHVTVRKVEARVPVLWPAVVFFVLTGLLMEWLSLILPMLALKTITGILGITFLWDAVELLRQERRVRKGHAPANPHNPRHARFLAEENSRATTIDWLEQDPSPY